MSPNESGAVPDQNTPPGTPTNSVGDPRRSEGQLPVILSVLAVILSASAVGLSVALPGHISGTQGPSGPGAEVRQSIITAIGAHMSKTTCGSFPGALVNFTPSRAGTVVITAMISVELYHTNGNETDGKLNIGVTTTDCSTAPSVAMVPSFEPTGLYSVPVTVVHSFVVAATSGNDSFSVNGLDISSGTNDAAIFNGGSIVGEYFPS